MNLQTTAPFFVAACLVFGQASASGFATPRIEPEVIGPECHPVLRYLPLVGQCHEPRSYDEPEGDDTPTQRPEPPKPPKPTECSSLWTPGAVLANGPKKDCA